MRSYLYPAPRSHLTRALRLLGLDDRVIIRTLAMWQALYGTDIMRWGVVVIVETAGTDVVTVVHTTTTSRQVQCWGICR